MKGKICDRFRGRKKRERRKGDITSLHTSHPLNEGQSCGQKITTRNVA
jgi:hypothetical protein